MKVLVIDIGGTNLKMLATGHTTPLKVPTWRSPELGDRVKPPTVISYMIDSCTCRPSGR